ncbi:substrate-binding periplasmic protein [Piscirickettsia litoralis]|uniref:Solute-binding protein family 3/N-terminal domain-containing protein n=1 Tax=Piscirickettsia litoralis TaxID=1891921 RepID=A0ABX3A3R7_9GAMM|nr:transporter substrate-binding domain-containing protein [Piscirickettsia litoralis]ODN43284.1 hypothetical protein BGC07_10585 [Piscirickettsia litoralis]
MKVLISLIMALVMSFFGLNSFAAKETVLLYTNYAPFSYGSTKSPQGLYPELIKAIFFRMDDDLRIQVFPWKRTLSSAEQGKGFIAGIYKTPKREEIFNYSQPFYVEEVMVFVPTDSAININSSTDLSALKGKNVGLVAGFSYGSTVDAVVKAKLFKEQRANSDILNFKKLLKGRLDAVISAKLTGQTIIAKMKLGNKIKMINVPVNKGDVYIAVSKKLADKVAVLDRFNKAIESMKQDGSYNKFMEEFIERAAGQ